MRTLMHAIFTATLMLTGQIAMGESEDEAMGTPQEGDTRIAALQRDFVMANDIVSENQIAWTIGRLFTCQSYDARSFQQPDAGSNNSSFFISFAQNAPSLYSARLYLPAGGQLQYTGGFDQYGLGLMTVTTGPTCAGKPAVADVRYGVGGTILMELSQLEACNPMVPPGNVTPPYGRPGVAVLSYITCIPR